MSKRKTTSEGAEASKRQAAAKEGVSEDEEASEGNWKETLFFWRGGLTLESPKKGKRGGGRLVWKGTWVGCQDDELPSEDDFRSSPNKFELKMPCPAGQQLSTPLQIHELSDVEGKWTGSYLLEGRKTKDIEHMFRIDGVVCSDAPEDDEIPYVAAALGDTPFGRFVSLGRVVRQTGNAANLSNSSASVGSSGLRLDLVRRYVDDDDPRAAWTSPEKLLGGIKGSAEHAAEPWKCLPLRLC